MVVADMEIVFDGGITRTVDFETPKARIVFEGVGRVKEADNNNEFIITIALNEKQLDKLKGLI